MEGVSTLSARKIWFDESVNRLNADERGRYLGTFSGEDKIIAISKSGNYRLTNYDLSTHFDDDIVVVEKFREDKPITAIYFDKAGKQHFLKRFLVEEIMDKKVFFIDEDPNYVPTYITNDWLPMIELHLKDEKKGTPVDNETINVSEFADLTKYRAKGKKLSRYFVKDVKVLESLPYQEKEEEEEEDNEDNPEREEIELDNNKEHSDEDFIQGSLF